MTPDNTLAVQIARIGWEGCGGYGCTDNMADVYRQVVELIEAAGVRVAPSPDATLHTCWDDHEGPDGTHSDGSPCRDKATPLHPAPSPDALREAIVAALNELGVPDDSYPAPVANAVGILRAALGEPR